MTLDCTILYIAQLCIFDDGAVLSKVFVCVDVYTVSLRSNVPLGCSDSGIPYTRPTQPNVVCVKKLPSIYLSMSCAVEDFKECPSV